MSLLADLLSKVKRQHSSKEIPPNLKKIVSASVRQSALKRKIILFSVFSLAAVVSGVLIVYYMQLLTEKLDEGNVAVYKQRPPAQGREEGYTVEEPPALKQDDLSAKLPEAVKLSESIALQQEASDRQRSESTRTENVPEAAPEGNKAMSETGEKGDAGISRQIETVTPEDIKTIVPLPIEDKDLGKDKKRQEIDAYLYTAMDYENKGDYSSALSSYKKALDLDKENFAIMNSIAYALLKLGVHDESIKYARMAVNAKGDYIPALVNLGIAYAKTGNISEAETHLIMALSAEPYNKSAVLNLAVLSEKKGDYIKSSEFFLRLMHLGDISGSLGLARIYEKQDRNSEALKIYNDLSANTSLNAETRQTVRQKIFLLNEKLKAEK